MNLRVLEYSYVEGSHDHGNLTASLQELVAIVT